MVNSHLVIRIYMASTSVYTRAIILLCISQLMSAAAIYGLQIQLKTKNGFRKVNDAFSCPKTAVMDFLNQILYRQGAWQRRPVLS